MPTKYMLMDFSMVILIQVYSLSLTHTRAHTHTVWHMGICVCALALVYACACVCYVDMHDIIQIIVEILWCFLFNILIISFSLDIQIIVEILWCFLHIFLIISFSLTGIVAGNFLVSKESPHRPILLDFGLTKKLSTTIKQALAKMFLASTEVGSGFCAFSWLYGD